MKQTAIRALTVLAASILVAPGVRAEERSDAWISLPARELAAERAGLRIGGLDVSVGFSFRDTVDGAEPAPPSSAFRVSDLGGLNALVALVNRLDGARIERNAELRVRIDGFTSVFGSSALRSARARVRPTFD